MPGLLSGLVKAGAAARIGANQGALQADQINHQRDQDMLAQQQQALRMFLAQQGQDAERAYRDNALGETARHNKEMEAAAKARAAIAGREPRDHYTMVPGQGPDGKPENYRVNTNTGEITPTGVGRPQSAGTGLGQASITKKLASNQQAMATVDDALAELERHPDAVGIKRAGPDMWNQRMDPQGVNARASLANIASMVIHDRSGAAVTVSEAKRLAPFIPSVSDNIDVARKKLAKLRALIAVETGALQNGPGVAHGGSPTTSSAVVPNGGGNTITVNGKTFVVPE